MNLPSFRKGEVLRAADLQALSDAVAAVNGSSSYVTGERGAPPEKFPLRTPIRDSGDARLALGYDNPGEVAGCDMQGRVLAVGYGVYFGPGTKPYQMLDCQPCIVGCTQPVYRGALWQEVMVQNDGTAKGIGKPFTPRDKPFSSPTCIYCEDEMSEPERPQPSRWWGDDGQVDSGGNLCGMGRLNYLVGCMKCNVCTYHCGATPLFLGSVFRRHELLPVPHLTFNAPGGCEAGKGLVRKQRLAENVSRVRRLRAGTGVCLDCCENFIRIHAPGLRPINPPGCWCGCGCEGETAAGGCTPACGGCTPAKPVQLVGCEYPAGAPTGVIIRQLLGRAGATVRRSGCMSCTVEVVSKVPVNAEVSPWTGSCCGSCCGSCGDFPLRLVTPECSWTCCTVPIRRIEAACGLRGDETCGTVRLWVDFKVRNCTCGSWGCAAEAKRCGWVQTLFIPAGGSSCSVPDSNGCAPVCVPQPATPCCNGSMRQLMRYWAPSATCSELQVVQQLKKDGVWVRFAKTVWPPPGMV